MLHKNGYREWAQTVTIKSTTDAEEIEPLLQSENPQFMRDIGKMTTLELGKDVAGQITRDSIASRDGKTFYNEYVLKVDEPDAFVIVLKAHGTVPALKLVDDSNVPYSIEKVGDDVFQTVFVPHPGFYYVQVVGLLDESTFVSDDYTIKVVAESDARAERPIAVGETLAGALEPTDRQASPGEFIDGWTLTGQAGTQVRIAATTDKEKGFKPVLTLFLDGKVVATSSKSDSKSKKKKGSGSGDDVVEIVTTLTGGTYTIFVRSASGPKTGPYQLSVAMGG